MRLRRRGRGVGAEVAIPAVRGAGSATAAAGPDAGDSAQRGIDPQLRAVLPERAESVGISLSAASREFIAASEDEFKALCERPLDGLEIAPT